MGAEVVEEIEEEIEKKVEEKDIKYKQLEEVEDKELGEDVDDIEEEEEVEEKEIERKIEEKRSEEVEDKEVEKEVEDRELEKVVEENTETEAKDSITEELKKGKEGAKEDVVVLETVKQEKLPLCKIEPMETDHVVMSEEIDIEEVRIEEVNEIPFYPVPPTDKMDIEEVTTPQKNDVQDSETTNEIKGEQTTEEEKKTEQQDESVRKVVANFLVTCETLLPPEQFSPVASKVLGLLARLPQDHHTNQQPGLFMVGQREELLADMGHVFIHIKAVLDKLTSATKSDDPKKADEDKASGSNDDSSRANEVEKEPKIRSVRVMLNKSIVQKFLSNERKVKEAGDNKTEEEVAPTSSDSAKSDLDGDVTKTVDEPIYENHDTENASVVEDHETHGQQAISEAKDNGGPQADKNSRDEIDGDVTKNDEEPKIESEECKIEKEVAKEDAVAQNDEKPNMESKECQIEKDVVTEVAKEDAVGKNDDEHNMESKECQIEKEVVVEEPISSLAETKTTPDDQEVALMKLKKRGIIISPAQLAESGEEKQQKCPVKPRETQLDEMEKETKEKHENAIEKPEENKVDEAEENEATTDQEVPKRKRGRPKGSKTVKRKDKKGVENTELIVSTELEPKTDVEIEEETNINEESLSEKESSKKLETDFNFNLEAGSPFEVVAFDPRCLLFQTTVLPQRIPEEVVEVTPDVTLAAILATARTGGSFTDLLLVATGEAKVNRKRERSEEVETFNESKKMKRAEIVFDDVVDIKTEEAS